MASELRDLAVLAARRAGELLLDRFASAPEGVSTKSSPTDLVSDADRDAEALIVGLLVDARPGDGILAEEGQSETSTSGCRWVIDPLDGTVNFLFGIPVWSVSIAVEDGDGTLAGAVHDPNRNETFAALRGGGATLDGRAISVSRQADLTQALVGTGFAYDAPSRSAQAAVVARILPRVRDIRRSGSAALDLCSVACGRYDAFYEAHMEPWDKAAGALIVAEAGGELSELRAPIGTSHGVIAANPTLHHKLKALIEKEN